MPPKESSLVRNAEPLPGHNIPLSSHAVAWGVQVYTIYSILFIVFIILIIVTAFITVALTYFQLAVEDHRWWWRSVQCGGSTGGALNLRH